MNCSADTKNRSCRSGSYLAHKATQAHLRGRCVDELCCGVCADVEQGLVVLSQRRIRPHHVRYRPHVKLGLHPEDNISMEDVNKDFGVALADKGL